MPTTTEGLNTGRARRVSLACYLLLIVVLSIEIFGITALEPASRAVVWVFFTGPLVVFLPGMVRGSWKTYLWLCFVLMVYFMVVVGNLFESRADAADWVLLLLICVLFNSAMLYARWRQRELAVTDS